MVSVLEELAGLFPAAAAETVYEVALDLISQDPDQPRKEFAPAELDDLALSIESNGVIAPVLLRPDPDTPGRYLIVTGERRYLASQRARRTTIPALIREVEAAALRVLQLIENVQRVDLRPEETARALESILSSTAGLKQSQLATLLGKSQAWVSQHLSLLHYEGTTREALDENLLQSPETARRFDQLPEEDRQQLLAEARATGAPITRTTVTAAVPVAPAAASSPPMAPAPETPAVSPESSRKKTGRPPKEKTIPLPPVTASQLALLFSALGLGSVPRTQEEVWQIFLARLTP